MNEIFKKRCADMTVFEVMEFAEMFSIMKHPTLSIDDFCKVFGKPRRRVNLLIRNKIIPEDLLVDGYDYKKLGDRKEPLFITEKVREWIKK